MEYADQFIEIEFVNIITETIKYAKYQNIFWIDTTDNEILVFIRVILLQSIVRNLIYQIYCTKHSMLWTPIFCQTLNYKWL